MDTEHAVAEILMATYNGEQYIREQINSILVQHCDRWHLTISDDGSTDQTLAIIDEYVERYPDKITRHHSGKKFGNARDHFFHLMNACEAQYMLFCDQDDVWYPEKLGKTLDELLKAERIHGAQTPILVFTDQTPTDAQLKPLAPSLMRYQKQFFEYFDYRSILMQNVVTGGAMGINRALADLAGDCKNSSQVIMHDWWLAAVAARFGKIVYIDEPLGDYRQHGTNSVGAKDVRSLRHIISKLVNLDTVLKTTEEKKQQARVFQATYGECLNTEDNVFLSVFVKRKSGPLFYWKNREQIHGFFRLAGMMVLG